MSAHYSLVIGNKNVSSWSLRAWLAMKMAKIPFEEIQIWLYQADTRDQIRKHSPSAKVPLLKITEGGRTTNVWDSLAICETLAERHPEARLWPADPAVRAHARSVSAEMHSGFPDLRRQLSMNITGRAAMPELDDVTAQQVERVIAIWTEALERHPEGGFLFGHFTIADAFYAPVATRFQTYGVKLPPLAARYRDHILSLAPMKEWIAAAKDEIQAEVL